MRKCLWNKAYKNIWEKAFGIKLIKIYEKKLWDKAYEEIYTRQSLWQKLMRNKAYEVS